MKSIKELANNGKVYIYLANEPIAKSFFRQAEQEGLAFSDGVKPTNRHYSDIMAVHTDGTISYVTAIGRMAFGTNAVTRIDFQRYTEGYDAYAM